MLLLDFIETGQGYLGPAFDLYPQDYAEAMNLEPKDAAYYDCRAGLYSSLKEDERAVQDYAQAIGLSPDLYFGRASANAWLGNGPAANGDVEKARELGLAPGPLGHLLALVSNLLKRP